MQDVEALVSDYASDHRAAGNEALHRAGSPAIMLALSGMLTNAKPVPEGR